MESSDGVRWLERSGFQRLVDTLHGGGSRVLGPVVRDGAVVLDEIRLVEELPVGWRDEQAPGTYRLKPSGNDRLFDVVNGPGSLKPLVFAPHETLLQIEMGDPGQPFRAEPVLPEPVPTAVIGVRACDLAALAVQDRVFLYDRYPDPAYASRRRGLLLVAVSCTRSVSTCFCTSFGSGPEATEGYDLALTEIDGGFLVRAGSEAGRNLLGSLGLRPAGAEECVQERRSIEACAASIERRVDTRQLPERLYERLDHPRWDDVAERCLSCGNCTLVCPTCFCHDERDEPALSGKTSLRVRDWDSCFNRDHSQVHGVNFRPRVRDRYRQWLVHKLAGWIDQFGTSGCVGCGRCLTWCPVGIDLTEELQAIQQGDA